MEDKIAIWECIEGLHQNMNLLGPKDIDFASSLLHSASTRGLSQKQEYWVRVLFERATKSAPQHKYIGDVSRLVEMLDEAAKRIKFPKFSLLTSEGWEIKVYVAGPESKRPGTINVTSGNGRVWYGRITKDGVFEPSRRVENAVTEVASHALSKMAEDPAGVATKYGRLTGRCCFCHKEIKTTDSLAVGYGPDCAQNYGLPY